LYTLATAQSQKLELMKEKQLEEVRAVAFTCP
jgi:hypothetical protein